MEDPPNGLPGDFCGLVLAPPNGLVDDVGLPGEEPPNGFPLELGLELPPPNGEEGCFVGDV
jgi:hypothetical protein